MTHESNRQPLPSRALVQTDARSALAHAASHVATSGDLEALERACLEWLVHPSGGRLAEAALLVWNEGAGRFNGWLRMTSRSDVSLTDAMGGRWRHADADANELEARFRRHQPLEQDLGPAESAAWSSEGPKYATWTLADGTWQQEPGCTAMRVLRDGSPYALIVTRHEPGAMVNGALEDAIGALQDGLACVERARRVRLRDTQFEALAEMTQSGVAAMNVAEALHLAARLTVRATGGRGSAVWRVRDDATRLEVTHGPSGRRERAARALGTVVQEAIESQSPQVVDSAEQDPRIAEDVSEQVRTAVVYPVIAYGRPVGAVAVYDRTRLHPGDPGAFRQDDIHFVGIVANQLALVLDQADRYDAVRTMKQQNEDLRSWMRREERLASLGEVAARGAREVRNPLASIAAFARRAHREMAEDDPHREYLEIVIRESDRLERIMDEQLDWATQAAPRLETQSVNTLVQSALQGVGEKIVRRRVRLLKNLAPDLPELLLDPDRMRLVMTNLANHALDAVSVGGRVRVASRRAGGHVIIEVAHDGPVDHGALMDELFVPFAAAREGAGTTGFGVANQVVREHGGEIRVRSDVEWSHVVSLSLPVRENEERRSTGPDRRSPRGDRRDRFPAV